MSHIGQRGLVNNIYSQTKEYADTFNMNHVISIFAIV